MAQTLTQLRAFVSVARLGSVQLAARELFVTQPSVSSAVAALSRELGAELFERHGRGVQITPAGMAYLPYAMKMLGLVEEGRAAIEAVAGTSRDTTRLIAPSTAADHFLPALIDAYRHEDGGSISLTVANRETILERVSSHEADIGISGPMGAMSRFDNLIFTPFLPNELIAVASPTLGDSARPTWLLREAGSSMRLRTESVLKEAGLEAADTITLGSAGAVKQALLLGVGASLVPRMVVSHELASGLLVELPIEGTPVAWPLHAITTSDIPPRNGVQQFHTFLVSGAAKQVLS